MYDLPSDSRDGRQAAKGHPRSVEQGAEVAESSHAVPGQDVTARQTLRRRIHQDDNAEGVATTASAVRVKAKDTRTQTDVATPHKESPATAIAPAPGARPKTTAQCSTKSVSSAKPKQTAVIFRTVPANELQLVSSVPNPLEYHAPASSFPSIAVQDPIVDSSLPPFKSKTSPTVCDDGDSTKVPAKTPVSALRARWKVPPPLFKAIRKTDKFQVSTAGHRSGDGFEDSELTFGTVKKRRKWRSPSIPNLASLELTNGPLPDVDFCDTPSRLKVESNVSGQGVSGSVRQLDGENTFIQPEASPPQLQTRRESSIARSSARKRTRIIMAELSTIRAPEREASEYDSQDEDGDHEDDVDSEENGAKNDNVINLVSDDDVHSDDSEPWTVTPPPPPPPPREQPTKGRGVTLDFRSNRGARRSRQPGRYSRPRRRPALIEVNEGIQDVFTPEAPQLPGLPPRVLPGPRPNGEARQQDSTTAHQPRSILKNSISLVSDLTSNPEATAANTRRNSIVDASRSSYFADASDILRAPDPARHIIMPRRRSSYFNPEQMDFTHDEEDVQETSPETANYITESDLDVILRGAEAVWTSEKPSTAAKDLRALTRAVSQGNGTLSQSVRRRPSLRFQSPTKIR
ncbi:uncharacterized protein LTR77_009039 [Saxophila tyrrhenica]|uniref:Uncharacterized protein n=1 Tax=Saxophila tyrrhenica TaxID=1690608 RepID=A0AAV9P0A7_9PEZI|nr:hypothetical protein LTR77_009039 [Saxophila tyrrhenica]